MSEKRRGIEDPNRLTGPEKAAVILLALGEEDHGLWNHLDEEEIREVSQAMSNLGTISATAVEKLIVDFVGQIPNLP